MTMVFTVIWQQTDKKAGIVAPGGFAAIPGKARLDGVVKRREAAWHAKLAQVEVSLTRLYELSEECDVDIGALDTSISQKASGDACRN